MKLMNIEFDAAKSARNARECGLPYDIAAHFDFDTAVIRLDTRRDYAEPRYQAFGLIGDRLYFLAFSLRGDAVMRCVLSACAKPTPERFIFMSMSKTSNFQKAIRRTRGPQVSPRKVQTAVRYDADSIEAFKSDGPGWQTRMNAALRDWLRTHHRV